MLPVVGLRAVEGRVGTTLVMQVLASSPEVVLDRRYPVGEYRYLSYCARTAAFITRPWRPEADPGVTELFFGEADRFGPLPFDPTSLDRGELERPVLAHLWSAFSEALLAEQPSAGWYAEKLATPIEPLVEAGIPLRLIDCIRDPRDVLVSIRAFVGVTGFDGFGRRTGEPEAGYLERWLPSLAERLDAMDATPTAVDRMVLRYEDFALDPPALARRLGDWLGLELDPAAGEKARAEIAHHLTTSSAEDSVGRWREELPAHEADLIWEALGSRLERHGYSRSSA